MENATLKEFCTIVESKDWNKFSKDLIDFTNVQWFDEDSLDSYSPFEENINNRCIIVCDPSYGTLTIEMNIDAYKELVSNENFIEKAASLSSKDAKDICCFVEKNIWASFVELIELNKTIMWGKEVCDPSKWYPYTNVNEDGIFIYASISSLGIDLYRSDIEDYDSECELLTKTEFLERVLCL